MGSGRSGKITACQHSVMGTWWLAIRVAVSTACGSKTIFYLTLLWSTGGWLWASLPTVLLTSWSGCVWNRGSLIISMLSTSQPSGPWSLTTSPCLAYVWLLSPLYMGKKPQRVQASFHGGCLARGGEKKTDKADCTITSRLHPHTYTSHPSPCIHTSHPQNPPPIPTSHP